MKKLRQVITSPQLLDYEKQNYFTSTHSFSRFMIIQQSQEFGKRRKWISSQPYSPKSFNSSSCFDLGRKPFFPFGRVPIQSRVIILYSHLFDIFSFLLPSNYLRFSEKILLHLSLL